MMAMEQVEEMDRKVCIGVIAGPHGVDGRVRVKSFTAEPRDVAAYGPVSDARGERLFSLELAGTARGMVLARIGGVSDRNAAEALRGIELYVDRDRLPEPAEDEFYHVDLIGLRVETPDGAFLGTVRTVDNYGAGDMVEIALENGGSEIFPFTRTVVPVVDLERGLVVLDPPHEIYVRPDATDDSDGDEEADK